MSDASVKNSQRVLGKVTYTPLELPPGQEGWGGALAVAAAVDQLGLVVGEATAAQQLAGQVPHAGDVLRAMEGLTEAPTAAERLAAAGDLAQSSNEALAAAVSAIQTARKNALATVLAGFVGLTRRYLAAQATATPPTPAAGFGVLATTTTAEVGPALATTTADVGPALATPLVETAPAWLSAGTDLVLAPTLGRLPLPTLFAPVPPPVADRLGPELAPSAPAAVRWAASAEPATLRGLLDSTNAVLPPALRGDASILLYAGLPFLIDQVQKTVNVQGHLTQRVLQPIGLLHLEQLVMTPLDIQRGELTYTLPLAPREKVTLSHKEWTLSEQEYTRFVQDFFQNYSERGVAQKTDIAVASKTESEHSKTLSMGKPLTPGAATLADTVQAQPQTEDVTKEKHSEQQSRQDTQEITEKASSLSIRDQKISFTVTTVAGTEDFTSRLYENLHPDKVMLVDYFRRMRPWQNDLYRVGIRLTYDVVLPDPGKQLRARWLEVKALDDQLTAPFQFEDTPPPPSSLSTLSVGTSSAFGTALSGLASGILSALRRSFDDLSVDELDQLARSYGTTLPASPDQIKAVEQQHSVVEPALRNEAVSFNVSVPIPPNYRVTRAWIGGQTSPSGDADVWIRGEYWSQRLDLPADGTFHTRQLQIPARVPAAITGDFTAHKGAVGNVRVWADVEPTPEAWRIWRDTAWNQIRQAAFARYNDKRDRLLQRRTALLTELQAPDTLSLRRMEREQIMYLVLQWLFPDFAQAGQAYTDVARAKPGSWEPALEYGEYIKFVHQAIDWDNALVVLYPYFWDNPETHATKLYLDHADANHREFLRAGAARIVLAIRPGYEEQVVSLLDKGRLGKLAAGSRFLPVIDQVRAANQRFAGMRDSVTSRPRGDAPAAATTDSAPPGDLIGQWPTWTPTSALDMEVRLRSVQNEP